MAEIVNVIVKEDPSVQKALDRTAQKLKSKYSKRRPINQKALKPRTPLQIFSSVVLNIITWLLAIIAGLVCISSVTASANGVCPSFAGYSNFRIVSASMVASGHKIGDTVIVRAVDTHTLKPQHYENGQFVPGDKIAFYQSDDISVLYPTDSTLIDASVIPDTRYKFEIGYLIGAKSEQVVESARHGARLVFHHVYEVREDATGTRWFKTYGSSNGLKVNQNDTTASPDMWWVREDMVIGIYDDSPFATAMSGIIGAFSASGGVFLLFIPVGLLIFLIVKESVRDVQLAKLELDCVEEKRKITDEICVRNGIGFRMNKETKYKILVQAPEKDRLNYISLLWKDNTVPREVKKYVLRKQALLKPTQRLLEVNRQCQQMFREGVDSQKIAKYYAEEKEKVEAEEVAIRQRVRELRKVYEAIYLADKAEQEKLADNKKNRDKFKTLSKNEILENAEKEQPKLSKDKKNKDESSNKIDASKPVETAKSDKVTTTVKPVATEKINATKQKEKIAKKKLDPKKQQEKNKKIARVLINNKLVSSNEMIDDDTVGGVLVPKQLMDNEKQVQPTTEVTTTEKVETVVDESVVEVLDSKAISTEKPIEEIVDKTTEAKTEDKNPVEEKEKDKKPVEEKEKKSEVAKKSKDEKKKEIKKEEVKSVDNDKKKTIDEKKTEVEPKKKPAKKTSTSSKLATKKATTSKEKVSTDSQANIGDKARKPRAKSKKVKRVFSADSKRLPRARKK